MGIKSTQAIKIINELLEKGIITKTGKGKSLRYQRNNLFFKAFTIFVNFIQLNPREQEALFKQGTKFKLINDKTTLQ